VNSAVLEKDLSELIKHLPLSNDAVSRIINAMGDDVEEKFIEILRKQQLTSKWMKTLRPATTLY